MSGRPTARLVALSATLALALGTLAACGDVEDPRQSGEGLDSVTIGGKEGAAPEVKFDGRLSPNDPETKVLTEGDGAEIAEGDSVLAHLWIGNGYTQEEAYSTWEDAPQLISLTKELQGPMREAVEGQKIGSRVAILSSATDSFGEAGNPELGIGNEDAVLWVIETESKILTGPEGGDREPVPWAPDLVETDGAPTGFDWKSTDLKPGPQLLDTTVIKGEGPVVKEGQTIYANYLGAVYNAKEPFDSSYTKGEPASFPLTKGGVIDGWVDGLKGRTVGSRVILRIPPAQGYGKEGNEQAGIKGTDTLYFVVDILGVA